MFSVFNRVIKPIVSAAMLCIASFSIHAAPLLNFDQITDGGTLSYDGVGGALIGEDIRFDNILGTGTALNDGTLLSCSGCLLDFTTGLNITDAGPVYQWSGGGSFVLTGTVMDGLNVVASGTLLSGVWDSPVVGLLNGNDFNLIGTGTDQKNQDLLDFFGITSINFGFSNSELSAIFNPMVGTGFTADVTEADLTNTPLPEPGPVALLSLGLIGFGLYANKRKSKQT